MNSWVKQIMGASICLQVVMCCGVGNPARYDTLLALTCTQLSPPSSEVIINDIQEKLSRQVDIQKRIEQAVGEVDSILTQEDRRSNFACQVKAFSLLKKRLPDIKMLLTYDMEDEIMIMMMVDTDWRYYFRFDSYLHTKPDYKINMNVVTQAIRYRARFTTRSLYCSL